MNGQIAQPETTLSRFHTWLAQSLVNNNEFFAYFEPFIRLAMPAWSTVGVRSRVMKVHSETGDVYSLVIRPGRRWKNFSAGQHVQISAELNGTLYTRTFSISTSPDYFRKTGLIELSIRSKPDGRVTPMLKEHFAKGGVCTLSDAGGDFLLPEGNEPLLLIAGGSGITPFRSMMNQLSSSNSLRDVHLLFYIRNSSNALFRQELDRIAELHPNLKVTFINTEAEGQVCEEHLLRYCPDVADRIAMVCGPTPMIQGTRNLLSELGLPADQIRFEYFGAAPIEMEMTGEKSFVRFKTSGIATTTTPDEQMSLLDLAEKQGLTPQHGCRIGVCYQCVCTKESGVVFNTRTGQYSDTGKEDIQLCISVAASDLELNI